jgi:hypothetical protein
MIQKGITTRAAHDFCSGSVAQWCFRIQFIPETTRNISLGIFGYGHEDWEGSLGRAVRVEAVLHTHLHLRREEKISEEEQVEQTPSDELFQVPHISRKPKVSSHRPSQKRQRDLKTCLCRLYRLLKILEFVGKSFGSLH